MRFKRSDLAKMFAEKGFTKGAEIGVRYGNFSRVLCETNSKLELKSVDPYRELYSAPETQAWGNKKLDKVFRYATNILSPYNCEIIRKTSLDASLDIENESLDFVYIDGSHEFDYVMTDIVLWGWKVKKGGIISGHDYSKTHWGVRLAVDTYAKAHEAKINLTEELTPSWWIERTW